MGRRRLVGCVGLVRCLAMVGCLALVGGCGASNPVRSRGAGSGGAAPTAIPPDLQLEARPIGRGRDFHLPATGPVIGRCRSELGSRAGVHLEVFAENRVVLVPAGIGTRPPLRFSSGRISGAHCYGDLVTLEPTGVVLVRSGATASLAAVFRSWGQPLTTTRVAAFSAPSGSRVRVYVDGRRWGGAPGLVPLRRHAEIVVEVGPYVPPHRSYTFPPGS